LHIDKNLGSKYVIGKNINDFVIEDIYSINDNVKVYLLIK